jgi:hypothetical protein
MLPLFISLGVGKIIHEIILLLEVPVKEYIVVPPFQNTVPKVISTAG